MAWTLIVPLIDPRFDPDGASEAALPVAQALAGRLDAEVLLVSVLELPTDLTEDGGQRLLHAADAFPNDPRLIESKEETLRKVANLESYLARMAERFQPGRVQTHIHYGDPAYSLLALAGERENALIVMASHGRSGLERLVVGSVAFSVVSRAGCPVLVVPVGTAGQPGDPGFAVRRVLIPLDGSLLAERVLDTGLDVFAGAPAVEIHLVEVIEPLVVRSGVIAEDYYAVAREEARQYLEGVAGRLRERGHQVGWSIQLGSPEQEIASVAREVQADLILMTTHGRSGFRRVFLGSVAESVLHTSHLPLLLIRPEREVQASNARPCTASRA
jgi:nucleotide-binding universal stress UspA family protein